ncbi:Response regulator receiver domain-containing protein [Desulfonauticus submarinus]|uniref:Response regulator receiver domain-containing protein n=1 Tax=Desulfonauticus submarinus TaxID=206665 RepID=A0A1H0FGG8_9BACT|nr:response regulator [Desulfonauticus submarinus]SDN93740.1 Response regulator receiver domain-containing protein [Desulfonauticus submarinus]
MAKILVLDDVEDQTILLKRILGRKNYEVITFTLEEEALNWIKDNPVDLAILDIKLKKSSGIEVLKALKNIYPKIKVIMLTGYPTLETAQQALQLGANEYLVKPIDKSELEEKVAKVLAE